MKENIKKTTPPASPTNGNMIGMFAIDLGVQNPHWQIVPKELYDKEPEHRRLIVNMEANPIELPVVGTEENTKRLARVAAEITRLRNENAIMKENAKDLCWQVWNMWNTGSIENFDSWWEGKQHELRNNCSIELPTVKVLRDGWISVEDGLPELNEPLMGYNDENIREAMIENYKATVMAYEPQIGICKAERTKNGWAEISSVSSRTIKPTHWQPLPSPPNESPDK